MIKLFFFGTLPLGWKRFFRAISFVWAFVWLFNVIFSLSITGFLYRDVYIYLFFCFGVPVVLSYAISGFFGKKTD